MRHSETQELKEQIRGAEVNFKVKAPFGTNIDAIMALAQELFGKIRRDPDNFDLFDKPGDATVED